MSVWQVMGVFMFGTLVGSAVTILYDIGFRRAKDREIEKMMGIEPVIEAFRRRDHAEH